MGYESQISFTLDTICPWTYLAKKRLDEALRIVRSNPNNASVTFTLHINPFQLYPAATQEGEDKYNWYRRTKYDDSEEKMKMYTTVMTAYGKDAGIAFKFGGTVANTLKAHRVIQHYQEKRGAETADAIVMSLYRQYFEEEKHPSETATLVRACTDAGVGEEEAQRFVEDEDEGLSEMDVKGLVREQAGNGVDSVPYVMIEGRRRDVTLVGAKEVGEYVKALEQIVKESS